MGWIRPGLVLRPRLLHTAPCRLVLTLHLMSETQMLLCHLTPRCFIPSIRWAADLRSVLYPQILNPQSFQLLTKSSFGPAWRQSPVLTHILVCWVQLVLFSLVWTNLLNKLYWSQRKLFVMVKRWVHPKDRRFKSGYLVLHAQDLDVKILNMEYFSCLGLKY